jgi:amino acid transporter
MEQAIAPIVEVPISSSGLRPNILSPVETLAQSISTIAPTTSPTMTVPLVFALAGNGTWLAYLLATIAILLIALCISRFARHTSCSGALYTYVTSSLPPVAGSIAGWALLLAYIATGAAVAGGFINYANVFLTIFFGRTASTPLLGLLCVAIATLIAYRDVQVSARLMLWIEAGSVLSIVIVIALVLWRNGPHIHQPQFYLTGVTPSAVRLGVVMALFSFVGFESATTLGHEAINPLRTIPRAVIQSAIFCGLFFILCAYTETLGMAAARQDLGASAAPLSVLANLAHVPALGPLIDFGALVSMFACTLACITAAARVLMRMAHNGLTHRRLSLAHHKNATPGSAVLLSGLLTVLPTCALAARGISGIDIYGWMGSLSVYGFMSTYGLAAIGLPLYLKRNRHLTPSTLALSIAATVATLLALAGTLYPVPAAPLNWLPYFFLIYILCGVALFYLTRRSQPASLTP